jgi:TrfA protein
MPIDHPGNPDLNRQLASLKKTVETHTERAAGHALRDQHKYPVQLPMWPEPVRGGPNAVLRSALFAAIHSKKRRKLGIQTSPQKEPEGVTIAAQDGITIKYAGTQLNQYDADVFFEALHLARHHPLETECMFRGSPFLRAIGRSGAKLNYEDLDDSLKRLRNGTTEIEWQINGHHYIFTGSLISSYVRDKTSKLYKVTFAKEIRTLFAPACWTQLEWDERMLLKGHPLAQWLHSYFSTHASPFPVSLAFLHQKTASPTTKLKHFRTEVKNALITLQEKLAWESAWTDDLLTVRHSPTASQTRHLARNAEMLKKRHPKTKAKSPTSLGDLLSGFVAP